jgi:hypothetical protein
LTSAGRQTPPPQYAPGTQSVAVAHDVAQPGGVWAACPLHATGGYDPQLIAWPVQAESSSTVALAQVKPVQRATCFDP